MLVALPFLWRMIFPKPVPPVPPVTTSVGDLGGMGSASAPPTPAVPPPVELAPPPVAVTPVPDPAHPPRKPATPARPAEPPAQTPAPVSPPVVTPPVVSTPPTVSAPATAPPNSPPPAAPSSASPPAPSAASPARSGLGTLQFEKAALLMSDGPKTREQDAVIRLEDTRLVVRDPKTLEVLQTLVYAKIESATYSETQIGLGFAKSIKHWLTLKSDGEQIVLRMDKTNYQTIIAEFESRSGVKVKGK
jgi:hypothetical protein